ncbi:MAG: hypothetical protein NTY38_33195, partial [Acidobacteria bacterium]|nr:hypothetical protein [Acidobacteriota bacterium]
MPSAEEPGFKAGYARPDFDDSAWGTAANLCLHSLSRKGAAPLPRVRFQGCGWFRATFALPESARGEEIHVVAGGYDQTDWNEYQVYLNGIPIGGRTSSGRWRSPCQIAVGSGSPAYPTLAFGPSGRNTLAIRVRGYDRH